MAYSVETPPKELEQVAIPAALASSRGVWNVGTVVWHVPPAPFATVECVLTDGNPDGLKTELLDVALEDLSPETSGDPRR